jgi:hypothetical protein
MSIIIFGCIFYRSQDHFHSASLRIKTRINTSSHYLKKKGNLHVWIAANNRDAD